MAFHWLSYDDDCPWRRRGRGREGAWGLGRGGHLGRACRRGKKERNRERCAWFLWKSRMDVRWAVSMGGVVLRGYWVVHEDRGRGFQRRAWRAFDIVEHSCMRDSVASIGAAMTHRSLKASKNMGTYTVASGGVPAPRV